MDNGRPGMLVDRILLVGIGLTLLALLSRTGVKADEPSGEDNQALLHIREVYNEMGYFAAVVKLKESSPAVKIFEVRPGAKYRFKEVKISGARRLYPDQLMQDAPIPGEVFTSTLVRKFLEKVVKKYSQAGAPPPEVSPDIAIDNTNGLITLTVQIKEQF